MDTGELTVISHAAAIVTEHAPKILDIVYSVQKHLCTANSAIDIAIRLAPLTNAKSTQATVPEVVMRDSLVANVNINAV